MSSRPILGPVPVSGDRASHAEYGVGPATDNAVRSGTAIRAPFAGSITTYRTDTGGNTIVVDGEFATMVGQHLSAYYRSSGNVSEGESIAASGNTGTLTSGAHFHWFIILNNGTRISGEEWCQMVGLGYVPYTEPWSYTPNGTAPASGGTITIPEEDDMTPEQSNQLIAVDERLKRLELEHATDRAIALAGKNAAEIAVANSLTILDALTRLGGVTPGVDFTDIETKLAEGFAAVNANINEIPVGFTPIIQK